MPSIRSSNIAAYIYAQVEKQHLPRAVYLIQGLQGVHITFGNPVLDTHPYKTLQAG